MMRTENTVISRGFVPEHCMNPWAQVEQYEASLEMLPLGSQVPTVCGSNVRRFVLDPKEVAGADAFARGSSVGITITVEASRPEAVSPNQVQSVRELRQLSGLTWQHLADMIGVSAKTLHNWAAGRPMDEKNLRRVGAVISLLRYIDRGNAEANRALLFNHQVEGQTAFELVKASMFESVRRAIGQGPGRAVPAARLPSSTIAAWGPENLGEQLAKLPDISCNDPELPARPTHARPASAHRENQ